LVNKNIYLSIFIVGSVFSLLSFIIEDNIDLAITILYLTIVIICSIRLFEEWRYYRSYNAPPASAIFVLLLSIIAVGSSLIANIATIGNSPDFQSSLLNIGLDLEILGIGSFFIFFNLFGLIFSLPSYFLLGLLIRRYLSGRYGSIFIFRKKYPNTIVSLYSILLSVLYIIYWWDIREIDLGSFAFVGVIVVFFLQFYVFRLVVVPVRRVTTSSQPSSRNRRITQSSNSSQPTRSSRSRPRSSTTRTNRTQRTSSISRNSSQSISRSTQRSRSTRASSVTVAPAINESKKKTTTKQSKLSAAKLKSLLPIGEHITEDDFRCIFCYELPNEKDRKVVICPHCHHPAHEDEFSRWNAVSEICSRCNKPIAAKAIIRLPGNQYAQVFAFWKKRKKS
jgi:hypothetical protein